VDNGSKIRIFNLLKGLSQKHEITLISFYDPSGGEPNFTGLLPYCQDIQIVPWKGFQPDSIRARLAFLSLKPRSIVDTFNKNMDQKIGQAVASVNFDLAIVSQVDMVAYSEAIRGLPAIFEEVEVGIIYSQYFQAIEVRDRIRMGLTWIKYRNFLASTMKKYAISTVVSQSEATLLSKSISGKSRIEIIPNFVDLQAYEDIQEQPLPNSLIFSGSFTYFPNYQAMLWFLSEIYPEIQARVPDVKMSITGNHAGLSLPVADHVLLTGMVENVYPHIARSWCSVVPLQTGGGTRLKVLEAMALRTPVVTTSKGAEGLDVQDGKHLLIADDPRSFSQSVIRLLRDQSLRQAISDEGYKLVREKYNWDVVMPHFMAMIDQVAN
jgi:glycosyltransferase involved in cell wall biosynthesis